MAGPLGERRATAGREAIERVPVGNRLTESPIGLLGGFRPAGIPSPTPAAIVFPGHKPLPDQVDRADKQQLRDHDRCDKEGETDCDALDHQRHADEQYDADTDPGQQLAISRLLE